MSNLCYTNQVVLDAIVNYYGRIEAPDWDYFCRLPLTTFRKFWTYLDCRFDSESTNPRYLAAALMEAKRAPGNATPELTWNLGRILEDVIAPDVPMPATLVAIRDSATPGGYTHGLYVHLPVGPEKVREAEDLELHFHCAIYGALRNLCDSRPGILAAIVEYYGAPYRFNWSDELKSIELRTFGAFWDRLIGTGGEYTNPCYLIAALYGWMCTADHSSLEFEAVKCLAKAIADAIAPDVRILGVIDAIANM